MAAKQIKPFHKPAGTLVSNVMEGGPIEDGQFKTAQQWQADECRADEGRIRRIGDRPLAAANLSESVTM
ncbi:hypothetical protein ACFSQT_21055 [Mesorhizobium calcicola]|uniref:Uncharacterized protein n=1 Tax=Mesorhizobium calcicola TaxID=1300310 RepID=A0ABW4WJ51_9HYPH